MANLTGYDTATGERTCTCFPNDILTTTAAGTAYTLTATSAALDFGTTDPVITLVADGEYLFRYFVVLNYVGATFAASQNVIFKLRKTSGTPADVTASSITLATAIITTLTLPGQFIQMVEIPYTGATGDVITIFGSVAVLPSAGSLTVTAAQISAQLQP